MQVVAERYDNDFAKMRSLSIIEEEGGKRVNMAHLVSSPNFDVFSLKGHQKIVDCYYRLLLDPMLSTGLLGFTLI